MIKEIFFRHEITVLSLLIPFSVSFKKSIFLLDWLTVGGVDISGTYSSGDSVSGENVQKLTGLNVPKHMLIFQAKISS